MFYLSLWKKLAEITISLKCFGVDRSITHGRPWCIAAICLNSQLWNADTVVYSKINKINRSSWIPISNRSS